jgi:hypothetical protein
LRPADLTEAAVGASTPPLSAPSRQVRDRRRLGRRSCHEVLAILVDAAHLHVDMRTVGVPVIDGDPIEPCAEIGFHLLGKVLGEGSEVGHLGASSGETMKWK